MMALCQLKEMHGALTLVGKKPVPYLSHEPSLKRPYVPVVPGRNKTSGDKAASCSHDGGVISVEKVNCQGWLQ